MRSTRVFAVLCASLVFVLGASPAFALANRVFVSARSGNNLNSCDNITTPCQSFAGAVVQLNPDGEVIVLDSGGYGPVTITKGVTIEAPPGVTAFIHPPSGDAITVNTGATDTVTLRGLTLNSGTGNGITVNSVGTLNVVNCSISGFNHGIEAVTGGTLILKGTDVTSCSLGVYLALTSGLLTVSVDHCHFDANADGYNANSTSPGGTVTTATYSTANGNNYGWVEVGGDGKDVINLEFCAASENVADGVYSNNSNAASAIRFSNSVFANNGQYGVYRLNAGTCESRGNNTATGNGTAPSFGSMGAFSTF